MKNSIIRIWRFNFTSSIK